MGSKKKSAGGRPRKGETALSRWLDQSSMTRDELAATLQVHRSTVDRLCRGARRPDLALAVEIEKLTRGAVPVSSWVKVPVHSKG